MGVPQPHYFWRFLTLPARSYFKFLSRVAVKVKFRGKHLKVELRACISRVHFWQTFNPSLSKRQYGSFFSSSDRLHCKQSIDNYHNRE